MEEKLIRLLKNPISISISITNRDDFSMLSMLSQKVNLDKTNALLLAARHQDINVMNLLFNYNLNINLQNDQGITALIMSASMGKFRLVEFLLKNGAESNIQDINGLTALIYTLLNINDMNMYKRYMKCLDILLSTRSTNVDLRDNEGMTALMYACEISNIEVVNLLLYSRANPFILNNNGKRAYDLCRNDEIKRLVRTYEEKINVEYQKLLLAMSIHITPHIAKKISGFLFM